MTINKKSLTFAFVLIASTMLSGCGGSTGEAGTASPKTAKINSDFVFMSDFIDALKSHGVSCDGYTKDDEVIGVREQGTCTYNGTELTLDIFADAKTAKTMTESLKAFGGYWVVSNNWVIVVQDGAVAKDLQTKLDASIA